MVTRAVESVVRMGQIATRGLPPARISHPWLQRRLLVNQAIGLNLGNAAWSTDEFERLIERLADDERDRLTIELHWIDALKDQFEGGRMIAEIREVGLDIAIDRIGIRAMPLMNLDPLDADWFKILSDKAGLQLLLGPDQLGALQLLRLERLILSNIDDELALDLGKTHGIEHCQRVLHSTEVRACDSDVQLITS